jgi:predicted glycosyltransferase
VRPRLEQLVRAERFAALGLIDMLHPDALSPEALGAWISGPDRAGAQGRIDTDGLDRFARLAAAAIGVADHAAVEPLPLPLTAAA